MATHHHVSPVAEESWGLLEAFGWFGNVENATTAVSKTSDKKHIQITFCPRPPPDLSRFYIHSPDGADMQHMPFIVATEEDLALLRVDTDASSFPVYYVYQADDGSGKPSLTLLPKTRYIYFQPTDIGLLRLPGKQFIVAGFRFLPDSHPDGGGLTLGVYDSSKPGADWKLYTLSLSVQGRQEYGRNDKFVHTNCKVLTIGGDAGTMAFVDLWWGVLFCDVLKLEREAAARQTENEAIPLLGYVSLPDDLRKRVRSDASDYRDIAFLDNHLKCVDLPTRSLWIRPATTSGAWSMQYMIRSFKEIANSNPRTNLLPHYNSVYGVYGSFAGLNIRQPVMGLQDDDDGRILYFVVKTDQTDLKGSVLAVDLSTKKILDVAPYVAREILKFDFTYMHTRLFKHLSGTKETVLQGSASKMKDKLFKHISGGKATLNQSGMVLQGSASRMKDKAQEQLDGESVAEDGDAMALD